MKMLKKVVAIAAAATVAVLSVATAGSGMTASAADQIAEAYFIGSIGKNNSYGESDSASVTAIDGDAQYAVTWKLDEAAETGSSWFLAIVITTEVNGTIMTNEVDGSNVNFTTDSYPDLAVRLDAIYIDGTEVTGFTVSSGAINTAYYDDSDPGVTRIYLHDDWAGTGTAILEDCTIESEVTAVFTISGTGQTGTSNVSEVLTNMVHAAEYTYGDLTYAYLSDGTIEISGTTSDIEGKVEIPAEINGVPVTSIGDNAFWFCDSLTSITIPDSVTNIGDYAFGYCDDLESVTIGSGVTSIGDDAFCFCDSLTSITIPDSVTSIGKYAFGYCYDLESVTIGNGVTSIEKYAFCDCTSLTSITIPDSVTSIGKYAFGLCSALKSVTIGSGVTSIGDYAFELCSALKSVTIGSGVTSIGDYAFGYCTSLTDVYYTGTKAQWEEILIGRSNTYLTSATIHYNADPTATTKPADLDGDDAITISDAFLCLTAYANSAAGNDDGLTEAQRRVADVDGDGNITIMDASYILQFYAQTAAGNSPTWASILGG